MIRRIIKDTVFLQKLSTDCTLEDAYLIDDMVETLEANKKICVGMAANMLGVSKNMISFIDENETINIMINPVIIKKELPYETEEGCLSLEGKRKCLRHKKIKVEYLNTSFQKRNKTYTGFIAEIIEHECDHLKGIII